MSTPKTPGIPTKSIADLGRLIADWSVPIQQSSEIVLKYPHNFPGKIPSFWDSYAKTIGEFITANGLRSVEEVATQLKAFPEQKPLMDFIVRWKNPKGGWPGAHLHYQNQMYPLTEVQWNTFSKSALTNLSQKLANPGNVTFEQFTTVVDAVATVSAR